MALLLSIMNILIAQITLVYNYCLFSVGKTVMNKLVYLFELDSVRKSKKEIIKAQKALYEEIVLNGNIVVMTMNQLSDSLGFLSDGTVVFNRNIKAVSYNITIKV